MSDGITFDSNVQEIIAGFARQPARLQNAIVRGTGRALLLTRDDVRKNAELKFTGGRGGLLTRLTSYAKKTGKLGLDAAIGFRKTKGFPYELSQEFGAKAKPGGAMAIPKSPVAIAAGLRGQGPRQLGIPLFVMGRTLAETKKGTIIVHYILTKSIRARLHFKRTVMANVPRIGAEIAAEYSAAGGR